jgi:hypothetical protein
VLPNENDMPPKEANPFGNPKPFLRAAAAGSAEAKAEPPATGDDTAAAPQKSKKQMHRKDKVLRARVLVALSLRLTPPLAVGP